MPAAVSNLSFNELGSGKHVYKDSADVLLDFIPDKPGDFFKAIYVGIDVLSEMGYEKGPRTNQIRHHANLAKLSLAPGKLLASINNVRTHMADIVFGDCSSSRIFGLFKAANSCISPIWEMVDFSMKTTILNIPKEAAMNLKGSSGAALIFAMGCSIFDTLSYLAESKLAELTGRKRNKEWYKVEGKLLKLAKEVSYLALGILTVLSVFFQVPVASITLTAFSASTVVFAFLEYFHDNIGTKKTIN